MKRVLAIAGTVLALGLATAAPANAGLFGGRIVAPPVSGGPGQPMALFMSGNGGTGKLTCSIPLTRFNHYLDGRDFGCRNDDARSVKIVNGQFVRLAITVCDDSQCRGNRPITDIIIRKAGNVTIDTFERGRAEGLARIPGDGGGGTALEVQVQPFGQGQIDGKVSGIRVHVQAFHSPFVV